MTYEMKDFQEDEKRLRKQAKDGEISEEEFFLALKKLHNRATEGDSHLVQLARSIGISEDELFSGEYGDNYDDILKNILDKAGITEAKATEGGFEDEFSDEDWERLTEYFRDLKKFKSNLVNRDDYLSYAKIRGFDSEQAGVVFDYLINANISESKANESIATEEEISDGIWLVDEEEQKELDKEKKRKEKNMNIDEDYMRSMGTVGSDEGFGGADFREEDHPRDEDGKFTSKGSGGSSQTTEKPKEGKTNPKEKKNFDKAVTRALKSLGEPKSDYDRERYNKINNLDGFPQDSSQLRSVGVKQKAPILKAHLSTIYPDNKFSVRIEYYSGGSSIHVNLTGGDAYPYGANKIGDLYKDSGSTNSMVDYFDYDNYVSQLRDERENKHSRDPYDIVDTRERRFGHWIYSKMNEEYEEYSNKIKGMIDLGITERIAKSMLGDDDSTGYNDLQYSEFDDLKKEFLELEKKEDSEEPYEVTKSTTPASYTQQYMHEDPDKPSEVPIDPTTKEELPVSSYNPNDSKYRKPKETDTKKDVTKAYGLMKGRKDNPDKPMWEDGEAKSNEDNPCWDGYTQYGMKEKGGKQVPNCVKESKATENEIEKKYDEWYVGWTGSYGRLITDEDARLDFLAFIRDQGLDRESAKVIWDMRNPNSIADFGFDSELTPLFSESKANEHDSLCPYCSKQIDDDDHWFEHIEKHRNGESRHHEQIDVKKKWLERCEVCGDIRSSHTNGIDHKFEVDATGTEFVNPKYLEMLGESILTKKNMSMEMVTFETMREAEKWWDKTHAGTHGRKYWKDMNIRERQKTILAYLETQLALTVESKLLEGRVSHVRKYALENKRIRFENPDPKFWWNDGEARTGTVLNEYRQSGLEWYSVNSGGQIYNVLKDDAELITGEVEEGLESCPECGNEVKDYLMKKHFENKHEEFINEHLWKDDLYLVENDHRNYSAIESDEEAKALLTDLTELDLLEDLKDNEEAEARKGEDEEEDLDLIEQLMDIEEDEIKEKIEEATPNSLIRYANPKKLPNGKTVMDRIRTSHPQVNESKLHSPIHISQYHQGDFSVTQICTECGQVIRGDPWSVDEQSMQHVRDTGHNSFKVEVEESIDVLGNIPFEAISTMAWNNLSPIIKEKIKQKISKEYWDDGKPTTTGEWWDMNDYEFKWSILKGFGSFAKSDELAKAYWRHLPDHVQNVVKRYRQIHFPDALGIEGISSNKNHNIDEYLEIAFQDFMKGKNSPNHRYEDTAYNKPNWDLGTVENIDFGEAKANEDSLLKVEEKPEGVDVTVLDEWENKKADENDLEGLIDMYSDTTSIPRNPTYPSEPLGSGTDTEECPFCGKLFDEFNLDHHVEQEHGVHTPSQYTQSTIMDNLNDEWLGEAWDKMSAKERRKLFGETKVECSRCGQPLEEDDKKGQDKHAKNRHSEQGQASDNLDVGKVEWVPLGTYKPMYESKASEADEEWDETPVQCPNCRGVGHFYHEDEDWEEMCIVCEGRGHIDRSFFQQGTNKEYYDGKFHTTHDWRGQPEILWESKVSKARKTCPQCGGNQTWVKDDDYRECGSCGAIYNGESKATEGGFGSGKKGHSAWMKDIEWGGNYKQCPICNINTNFTSGKCEICGNSFA